MKRGEMAVSSRSKSSIWWIHLRYQIYESNDNIKCKQ